MKNKFFQKIRLPLFPHYDRLTSCKDLEKLKQFLRKTGNKQTDGHTYRHVQTMRKGCTPKWALEGVCQIVCFESFQFWKKCV